VPKSQAKAGAQAKAAPKTRSAAGNGKPDLQAVPSAGTSAPPRRTRAATKPAAAAGKDTPPPAGWATPEDAGGTPPGPFEVVTTAVRAAGELAQLGAAVGGHAVKGLLSRIPKP